MEEDRQHIFRTCRNYKKGIYVFNAYKKSDFIILLVSICIGLIVLFIGFRSSETARVSSYIAIVIIAIPAFLTMPLPGYHAMYYRLYYLIKRYIRPGIYVWAGRKDCIEEILNEDDV